MLRKMTAIGLALGMLLPGAAVLAETAKEQKEEQVRTEQQEMLQKGSPAAGEQERTRTREYGEDAKQYQKRSGQDAASTVPGDQLQDRDRTRDKDKDLDKTRDRDRGRLHDGGGTQHRKGGR
jgi:hypothetical protein